MSVYFIYVFAHVYFVRFCYCFFFIFSFVFCLFLCIRDFDFYTSFYFNFCLRFADFKTNLELILILQREILIMHREENLLDHFLHIFEKRDNSTVHERQ